MSRRVHTPATIRRPRRFAWSAAVVVAVFGAVLLVAAPAAAHDELIGTDPADGSSLDTLPAEVRLEFSAELLADDGGTEVHVLGPGGDEVQSGDPVVNGTIVTQAIDDSGVTTTADYTVQWKVVSGDGHPISGEFSFTVEGAAPEPTATTAPEPSDTTAPEPSDNATPSPAPDDDASTWLPWVIGGVVALLVLAAAVYLLASRPRRGGGAGGEGAPGDEPPADR